jgi:hypothetical protein
MVEAQTAIGTMITKRSRATSKGERAPGPRMPIQRASHTTKSASRATAVPTGRMVGNRRKGAARATAPGSRPAIQDAAAFKRLTDCGLSA